MAATLVFTAKGPWTRGGEGDFQYPEAFIPSFGWDDLFNWSSHQSDMRAGLDELKAYLASEDIPDRLGKVYFSGHTLLIARQESDWDEKEEVRYNYLGLPLDKTYRGPPMECAFYLTENPVPGLFYLIAHWAEERREKLMGRG